MSNNQIFGEPDPYFLIDKGKSELLLFKTGLITGINNKGNFKVLHVSGGEIYPKIKPSFERGPNKTETNFFSNYYSTLKTDLDLWGKILEMSGWTEDELFGMEAMNSPEEILEIRSRITSYSKLYLQFYETKQLGFGTLIEDNYFRPIGHAFNNFLIDDWGDSDLKPEICIITGNTIHDLPFLKDEMYSKQRHKRDRRRREHKPLWKRFVLGDNEKGYNFVYLFQTDNSELLIERTGVPSDRIDKLELIIDNKGRDYECEKMTEESMENFNKYLWYVLNNDEPNTKRLKLFLNNINALRIKEKVSTCTTEEIIRKNKDYLMDIAREIYEKQREESYETYVESEQERIAKEIDRRMGFY